MASTNVTFSLQGVALNLQHALTLGCVRTSEHTL